VPAVRRNRRTVDDPGLFDGRDEVARRWPSPTDNGRLRISAARARWSITGDAGPMLPTHPLLVEELLDDCPTALACLS
jgi:hypothetical protein